MSLAALKSLVAAQPVCVTLWSAEIQWQKINIAVLPFYMSFLNRKHEQFNMWAYWNLYIQFQISVFISKANTVYLQNTHAQFKQALLCPISEK